MRTDRATAARFVRVVASRAAPAMGPHLLNLLALADAPLDSFELRAFGGTEAISTCFDFQLDLYSTFEGDLSGWIGKLAKWDVSPHGGSSRVFAGRIYTARRVFTEGSMRILVHVGPAYHALAYARATHFVQDKNSRDIFEAMTADVPGLVKSVNLAPAPPVRGYSVRYDETEIAYLDRLLAQDGIMYFFVYDRGAGPYQHKMIVTNKAADYIDVVGGPVEFLQNSAAGSLGLLERQQRAAARKHDHVSFNVNKLDTPFKKGAAASQTWGSVYSHSYETIGFEALAEGDVASRQTAIDQGTAETADVISGESTEPTFMAGGRVEILGEGSPAPKRIVLTRVVHSAIDPWMEAGAAPGQYSNSFQGVDAGLVYRPPHVAKGVAPGPLLGVVSLKGAAAGEAKIDKEWRVPVAISNARDYADKGLNEVVWLPVQQQWAHSTHGAQFFPRIGTRVIIDFLYGNPDLPFISGTVYTPSQAYPFDPTSKATQTGWRSVTDKNGSIVQEFRFEDKPGSEEVYLYTGRDYRRVIDQDDWGTVKRDQTLKVQRDQKLTVTRDRTLKIDGKQKTNITKTRAVTINDKSLVESYTELKMKVGKSSITLTPMEIKIEAPFITIKSEFILKEESGMLTQRKSKITMDDVQGIMMLKGGIILIN